MRLFFKHRIKELYIHQLHIQHEILHQVVFISYSTKLVSMFGVSSRLAPGMGGWRRERLQRETGMVLHVQRAPWMRFWQIFTVYKVICFHRSTCGYMLKPSSFSYLTQFVQETAPCNLLCLIVSLDRGREQEELFSSMSGEKCPRHWAIAKFHKTLGDT